MRATSVRAAVHALGSIALVAQAAFGQGRTTFHQSVSGSAGIFNTDRNGTGFSFTGGFLYANEFVGLAVLPIDLGITPEDSTSQYRSETLSGGTTRCYERATGQLVRESKCGSGVIFAASAEALAALPIGHAKSIGVGAGYRAGNSSGVYGIVSTYFGPMNGTGSRLTLRLGQSFFDLGFGWTIRLK